MNELQQAQRFQRIIKPTKTQKEIISLYMSLITEEYDELMEAQNLGNMLKECGDLITVVVGLLNALNADANEVLKCVNESNMSKACLSERECIDTERAYKMIGVDVYSLHQDDCYCVYSLSDQVGMNNTKYTKDKLLKAINYSEVNENELAKLASIDL